MDETEEETNKDELHFFYDSNSKPAFVEYNGEKYRYIYNLQGDIVGILDSNNSLVVEYEYDAWGKPISMTGSLSESFGILNPFRYRGYVWDEEKNDYYVISRYCSCEHNSWINADSMLISRNESSKGKNLFEYCYNSPVMMKDVDGFEPSIFDSMLGKAKLPIKWITQKISLPFIQKVKENMSEKNITYSSGMAFCYTPSKLMTCFQIGGAIDAKGNVIVQATKAYGITTSGIGAALTTYRGFANTPTLEEYNCFGRQAGSSLGFPICGVPATVGCDTTQIIDDRTNKSYFAVAANTGLGSPGFEMHIMANSEDSWTIHEFNIYEWAEQICNRIMVW